MVHFRAFLGVATCSSEVRTAASSRLLAVCLQQWVYSFSLSLLISEYGVLRKFSLVVTLTEFPQHLYVAKTRVFGENHIIIGLVIV